MNLPKIHSREMPVEQARIDFDSMCEDFLKKHELTDIEFLQILNGRVATRLKYMLRYERHGDADKPAGIE